MGKQNENKKTLEQKAYVRNGKLRLVVAGIAIILEIVLLILLFVTRLGKYAEWITLGSRILAALLVLGIYSQHKSSSVKMPWIILILAAPVVGTVLYLFVGLTGSTRKMRRRYEKVDAKLFPWLIRDKAAMDHLKEWDGSVANVSGYILNEAKYPVYQNIDIEFYDDASDGLAAQKLAMRGAKKFIFMEYHAIEDAESWRGIQEILEEKVKEGVEVRVFYDDMGSIGFINKDFVKRLEKVGIACRVFNPMVPVVNLFLNNRDHRKITVIDGEIGFTDGYNLANEYFNLTHPYGEWKDTGIRLRGKAVEALTVTFLEMWNAVRESDKDDTDYVNYLLRCCSWIGII